jgi:hypothetical protein
MVKDYSFGTERSTEIINYHLKDRMEGEGLILLISGRNGWKEACGFYLQGTRNNPT